MAKSNGAEVDRRVIEVYTMLSQGYRYIDILRYCTEKYKISSDKTVQTYIKKAMDFVRVQNAKSIEELRVDANERFNDLYIEARKAGHYRDAAYIQGLKNKINGLEVLRLDATLKGGLTINISYDKKKDG